jgi:hypothetical protein
VQLSFPLLLPANHTLRYRQQLNTKLLLLLLLVLVLFVTTAMTARFTSSAAASEPWLLLN